HFIHIRQAFSRVAVDVRRAFWICLLNITRAALASDSILDQIPGFRHSYMRVDIDNLCAPAAYQDLPPFAAGSWRCGGLQRVTRKTKRRLRAATASEHKSRGCSGDIF